MSSTRIHPGCRLRFSRDVIGSCVLPAKVLAEALPARLAAARATSQRVGQYLENE